MRLAPQTVKFVVKHKIKYGPRIEDAVFFDGQKWAVAVLRADENPS